MKKWALLLLSMILALNMVACDSMGGRFVQMFVDMIIDTNQELPDATLPELEKPITESSAQTPTTQKPTEALTTDDPTTEEPTTEEPTTEAPVAQGPTREEVKAVASAFIEADEMIAASQNEQYDWSDFGGLTKNEDGSVTALFQAGADSLWDPYCYLIKQYTAVDNIMVIQYRCTMECDLMMYLGTEGNIATGAGDAISATLYATGDGWSYLIIDMETLAGAYDATSATLGYLRFGLTNIESGDTIDIGYIAFFHTMEDVETIIPTQP